MFVYDVLILSIFIPGYERESRGYDFWCCGLSPSGAPDFAVQLTSKGESRLQEKTCSLIAYFISICTGTEGQRDLATEQDKNMLRVHHALESCGLSPSGVPDVTVERAQHDNILDVSKGES